MPRRIVYKTNMNTLWNENRIRDELKRLDTKTGLNGAELPIKLGSAKTRLGSFRAEPTMGFRFSKVWFHNPEWSEEAALDVIRHEYAHYMTWMLYKTCRHDKQWKECCAAIGAKPTRLYKEHESQSTEIEPNRWRAGQKVKHPSFGIGVITAVSESIVEVEFKSGKKYFSMQ